MISPYHERMNTMTTLELILTIIQLISGLAVTVIVLMQSGKSAGLSCAISGMAVRKRSFPKAKPRRSMPSSPRRRNGSASSLSS